MSDIMVDDTLSESLTALIPKPSDIQQALRLSCQAADFHVEQPELCIRFADDTVVQTLNAQWRNQDRVTDVLSFPMQEADELTADEPLGDIILALPFVIQEADRLQLAAPDHILHLIVHGTLHLLGYDHIDDADAAVMQPLECQIMQQLYRHNPYPDLNTTDV